MKLIHEKRQFTADQSWILSNQFRNDCQFSFLFFSFLLYTVPRCLFSRLFHCYEPFSFNIYLVSSLLTSFFYPLCFLVTCLFRLLISVIFSFSSTSLYYFFFSFLSFRLPGSMTVRLFNLVLSPLFNISFLLVFSYLFLSLFIRLIIRFHFLLSFLSFFSFFICFILYMCLSLPLCFYPLLASQKQLGNRTSSKLPSHKACRKLFLCVLNGFGSTTLLPWIIIL
jgi:hypothetical protein